MTREEAIKIIKIVLAVAEDFEIIVQGEEFTEEKCKEAVEMATEALEQEPCEMTAEEYRQRMIQAFHNADCDELIALVVLPTEKEFEHLGWLLEEHYKAKPEPCENIGNIYKCSCGYGWDKSKVVRHHFCPNCGRAVDSTELEPCTDAISREKALQIIRAWFDREATPSDLKNEIEQLPPVTPQYTEAEIQKMQDLEFAEIQKAYEIGKEEGSSEKPNKWIPVSERLPEVGSEVLVCYDFKGKRSVYIADFYGDGEFHGYDDEYLTTEGRKYRKAVAWMPLPKPWKGE